jgi:hypothetical protein
MVKKSSATREEIKVPNGRRPAGRPSRLSECPCTRQLSRFNLNKVGTLTSRTRPRSTPQADRLTDIPIQRPEMSHGKALQKKFCP